MRSRYGAEMVFLAGHSWGSYLGMLFAARHPELLRAYIGIGRVVDDGKAVEVQDEFVGKRARKTGEEEALREL